MGSLKQKIAARARVKAAAEAREATRQEVEAAEADDEARSQEGDGEASEDGSNDSGPSRQLRDEAHAAEGANLINKHATTAKGSLDQPRKQPQSKKQSASHVDTQAAQSSAEDAADGTPAKANSSAKRRAPDDESDDDGGEPDPKRRRYGPPRESRNAAPHHKGHTPQKQLVIAANVTGPAKSTPKKSQTRPAVTKPSPVAAKPATAQQWKPKPKPKPQPAVPLEDPSQSTPKRTTTRSKAAEADPQALLTRAEQRELAKSTGQAANGSKPKGRLSRPRPASSDHGEGEDASGGSDNEARDRQTSGRRGRVQRRNQPMESAPGQRTASRYPEDHEYKWVHNKHAMADVGLEDWYNCGARLSDVHDIVRRHKISQNFQYAGEPTDLCDALDRFSTLLTDSMPANPTQGQDALDPEFAVLLDEIFKLTEKMKTDSEGAGKDAAVEAVKSIYTYVIPRLAMILISTLRLFGTKPKLNVPQLETASKLISAILSTHDHAQKLRKNHDNFDVNDDGGPIVKVNERILSRIKEVQDRLERALNLEEGKERARQRLQMQEQHRLHRQQQQDILDAQDAKLDEWRAVWRHLHAHRRNAEFASGRTWVPRAKLDHLRDIPVDAVARDPPSSPYYLDGTEEAAPKPQRRRPHTNGDALPSTPERQMSDDLIEVDAEGTPMQRVSVFAERTRPPPRPLSPTCDDPPVYNGPKWSEDEDTALLRVLENHAGDGIWYDIIQKLCRPHRNPFTGGFTEAVLGRFNMCEIVEMGVWYRDAAVWAAREDGEEVPEWVARVWDPRVQPDLGEGTA